MARSKNTSAGRASPKKCAKDPRALTQAKSKAKAKAQRKTSDTRVVDPPSTPGKRVRNQLGRRDMEEKVNRVLNCGRLSHIPKCIWTTKRNAAGLSVPEYVEKNCSINPMGPNSVLVFGRLFSTSSICRGGRLSCQSHRGKKLFHQTICWGRCQRCITKTQ